MTVYTRRAGMRQESISGIPDTASHLCVLSFVRFRADDEWASRIGVSDNAFDVVKPRRDCLRARSISEKRPR